MPGRRVTIAISTYNNGSYLRPSVLSALAQTHDDLEVIVVDDGSTDGSADTLDDLDDPRLTVIRQTNTGKSAALNRIRRQATGDFFVIHDGDDLSHPRRVETQLAFLLRHPDHAACFSRHDLLLGETTFAPRHRPADAEECARFIDDMKMPAIDPTGMYRTSMTTDLDYDEELRIGQGFDMILRVGERAPIAVLGESLYSYRVDNVSTTRTAPAKTLDHLITVRRKAAERRGSVAPPAPPPTTARGGPATITIVGHVIESVLDARLLGKRREAISTALFLARRTRFGLLSFKPLAFALVPRFVLAKKRPEFADITATRSKWEQFHG